MIKDFNDDFLDYDGTDVTFDGNNTDDNDVYLQIHVLEIN